MASTFEEMVFPVLGEKFSPRTKLPRSGCAEGTRFCKIKGLPSAQPLRGAFVAIGSKPGRYLDTATAFARLLDPSRPGACARTGVSVSPVEDSNEHVHAKARRSQSGLAHRRCHGTGPGPACRQGFR